MSIAEEFERGLAEVSRATLADMKSDLTVLAERGQGHTINALRRRGLVVGEPYWSIHPGDRTLAASWRIKLTPMGVAVAGLAQTSTRPGGGCERRRS